jgi:hypothetical protein
MCRWGGARCHSIRGCAGLDVRKWSGDSAATVVTLMVWQCWQREMGWGNSGRGTEQRSARHCVEEDGDRSGGAEHSPLCCWF